MILTFICFVLLVRFISRTEGEQCIFKLKSGEKVSVCCADYEAKDGNCIACSKGYTSYIAQKCRPCPNNTYGERCRYDCSCSIYEICDIMEGCLEIPRTTQKSEQNTSGDGTYIWSLQTSTDIDNDTTTVQLDHDESTNGKSRKNSDQGLLSTEIVLIFILSVTVIIFGICLCFIYYKYKSATKMKKTTIIQSPIPLIPQNDHSIEIEDRLYDIINDADLVDDHDLHQMQMSADYLDVISTDSGPSSCIVKHFPPRQMQRSPHTKKAESKVECSSLISVDSTSSNSDEYQESTQDYLNPYQIVIKMSPPKTGEYLTLPPIHEIDSSFFDYKTDTIITNEYVHYNPLQLENGALKWFNEYGNYANNFGYTDFHHSLSNIREQESMSCAHLNITKRPKIKSSSEKDGLDKNQNDHYAQYYHNLFKTKSESDIFCKNVLKK